MLLFVVAEVFVVYLNKCKMLAMIIITRDHIH